MDRAELGLFQERLVEQKDFFDAQFTQQKNIVLDCEQNLGMMERMLGRMQMSLKEREAVIARVPPDVKGMLEKITKCVNDQS